MKPSVALFVASTFVLLCGCQQQTADLTNQRLPVRAIRAEVRDVSPVIALTGTIAARTQSDLSFRGGGRLIERRADVGAHVTAGQVLARIDPQEQQASLRAAAASVAAAEAQFRQASSTLARQKALLEQGYTTRADYGQAEEAYRVARGTLDSAKAQLATVRDELSQTDLRASAGGIVTGVHAETGQVVQAAQAVFTLAEDGSRDAVLDVPEWMFGLGSGTSDVIAVQLVTDPAVTATGHVREIAPAVDTRTGTVRVKVGLDAAPPAMTLGASVAATGGQAFVSHGVTLPWQALTIDRGKPAVWILDPRSATVALRSITVARYQSGSVVVGNEIAEGEWVITDGAHRLHPQQTVAWEGGR